MIADSTVTVAVSRRLRKSASQTSLRASVCDQKRRPNCWGMTEGKRQTSVKAQVATTSSGSAMKSVSSSERATPIQSNFKAVDRRIIDPRDCGQSTRRRRRRRGGRTRR